MYSYGKTSVSRIKTGTIEMQAVIYEAMRIANKRHHYCPDITILSVLRTAEEQFELYKVGRQLLEGQWVKTYSTPVITYCDGYERLSRHQSGNAVDFSAYLMGKTNFRPEALAIIATCFMQAASRDGFQFQWGGHWSSFYDGGHFHIIT